MDDCIFCKIIRKEISAEIVRETSDFIALVDIAPNNFGHTLIIPKKHFANIYEFDAETLAHLGSEIQIVAKAVKTATNAEGINIIMNNEEAAGQIVFHAHVHIIPRFKGDGHYHWDHKKYESSEAMKEMADKIRASIV